MSITNIDNIIISEAKRLADKYQKESFDCKDLVEILGVGTNSVRDLMNHKGFPTQTIGKRKVVTITNYVIWSLKQQMEVQNGK